MQWHNKVFFTDTRAKFCNFLYVHLLLFSFYFPYIPVGVSHYIVTNCLKALSVKRLFGISKLDIYVIQHNLSIRGEPNNKISSNGIERAFRHPQFSWDCWWRFGGVDNFSKRDEVERFFRIVWNIFLYFWHHLQYFWLDP